MERIVLDTGVAALSYQGRLPQGVEAQLVGHVPCVTFVTVSELARWAEKRAWGRRARTALVNWLGHQLVLPCTESVAWTWGRLMIAAERRDRPRPLGDTWIAACCITAGLPLATRRVTDFAEYDGLTLFLDEHG